MKLYEGRVCVIGTNRTVARTAEVVKWFVSKNYDVHCPNAEGYYLKEWTKEFESYMKTSITKADLVYFVNADDHTMPSNVIRLVTFAKRLKKTVEFEHDIYQPEVITITGSHRFLSVIHDEAEKMRKRSCIVYEPVYYEYTDAELAKKDELGMTLRERLLHARHKQIETSNRLSVINPAFMGPGIKAEIEYAELRGIPVTYFTKR